MAWLSGWNRRKSKIVNGSTAGSQINYQMKLNIHKGSGTDTATDIYLEGNVRDDFGDVRFTSSDGSTLLNYWIESYTSGISAIIWAKIDSIPIAPNTTTIYVYYDNIIATSISNPNTTYEFFDDASSDHSPRGTVPYYYDYRDTNYNSFIIWNSIEKTYTKSGLSSWGYLLLSSSYKPTHDWNYIEWRTATNWEFTDHKFNAADAISQISDTQLSYSVMLHNNGTIYLRNNNPPGTIATASWIPDNNYHILAVAYRKSTGYTKVFLDGVLKIDTTLTALSPQDGIGFGQYGDSSGDWGKINILRVRKYADPEPIFGATGLEELSYCPISPKYEGETVHLSATPKDGTSPYYVEFRKNDIPIASYSNSPENVETIYDYILTNEDIRTAYTGTINFSTYISDSCPTGSQTCTQECIITIGCMAPVCNFMVT